MLVLIVATGATVRLTGSGLGCEHWPGCAAAPLRAEELPQLHRVREPRDRVLHDPRHARDLDRRAAATGGSRSLTSSARSLQAPLGAITVHYHLNPWLVLSHFLLSLVVLTLGVVLAMR